MPGEPPSDSVTPAVPPSWPNPVRCNVERIPNKRSSVGEPRCTASVVPLAVCVAITGSVAGHRRVGVGRDVGGDRIEVPTGTVTGVVVPLCSTLTSAAPNGA